MLVHAITQGSQRGRQILSKAQSMKMLSVEGHNCQAMGACSRRNNNIGKSGMNAFGFCRLAHRARKAGDRGIHRQDAFAIAFVNGFQPVEQCLIPDNGAATGQRA